MTNTTDDSWLLTAPEAAAELGVDRETTRRVAKAGQVPGARLIGPSWVATRGAWRTWFEHRKPAGRPKKQEVTTMTRWTTLELVDGDGCSVTGERRIAALREYQAEGSINGVFFARMGLPHEDLEDASTWGPQAPAHVDWTGFEPKKQEGPNMTNRMTPAEAWDGYVGAQTPVEFMDISRQRGCDTVEAAVAAYVAEARDIFRDLGDETRAAACELLAEYISRTFRETAEALTTALNAYNETTDPAEANPWEDVIRRAQYAEYIDWPASEAIGSSDEVILLDGTRVRHDHEDKTWQIE